MPEMPEIETHKRKVLKTSLDKRISKCEIIETSLLKNVTKEKFQSILEGSKFSQTSRHGKHLFLGLDNKNWLRLHFGMS